MFISGSIAMAHLTTVLHFNELSAEWEVSPDHYFKYLRCVMGLSQPAWDSFFTPFVTFLIVVYRTENVINKFKNHPYILYVTSEWPIKNIELSMTIGCTCMFVSFSVTLKQHIAMFLQSTIPTGWNF